MKKAVFLLPLLLAFLMLLPGCVSAEAKEPMPQWPERLTGEYDDALTFTFRGEAPAYTGVDSQGGRMTALFPTDDGYLVLGWRRLTSSETELMEEFLAGTGGETGVWDLDSDPYSTLESYVRLGKHWYCLSAACDGLEETELLRLVDGTVEASAEGATALPRASSARWLELLPWEEEWTCLLLGYRELEPEAGKEALHSLLSSYEWQLVDPAAKEAEYIPSLNDSVVPRRRQTFIYLDEVFTRDTTPLTFHLRSDGEVFWNGTLRRPAGEGAGEKLLEAWTALSETGVNVNSPPRLTLKSGEEQIEAILGPTFSWYHITRIGGAHGTESDGVWYGDMDWLSLDYPILAAEGPISLDFSTEAPDRWCSLSVFSGGHEAPLALMDGRFTPLAGLHTYVLSCSWSSRREEPGGSGSCFYILLIDGGESLGPAPGDTGSLALTIREADVRGCAFTLENRGNAAFRGAEQAYVLLRRTPAGGWDWVEPIRTPCDGASVELPGNSTLDWAWDWSYACGQLPAGEYRLQLRGTLVQEQTSAWVSAAFTIADAGPEAPGPLTLCPLPEGMEDSLTRLSPHRWVQTLRAQEQDLRVDRDFSLFRLSDSRELTYIPPDYLLPAGLNEPFLLRAGQKGTLEADLAAQYGELEAGTYVLRRGILCLTREDRRQEAETFRSWRLAPEDRIRYWDTVFTLTEPLSGAYLPVEPLDERLYTGETPELPVDTGDSLFWQTQARLHLEAPADWPYTLTYDPRVFFLYFLQEGEWLPMKKAAYPDLRQAGYSPVTLAPGEAEAQDIYLFTAYDPLEPGTYRLVLPCSLRPPEEGAKQEESFLVLQFRLREDGHGVQEFMEN